MSCFWLQHHCTQSWLIHNILIQSYQSFHLILCDSLICTHMFKIWRHFPSAIWPSWKERQWSSAHGIWRCGREFQKYHPRILQPWRITKSRPWCSSRHTCDSLRVSRILLSLFWIFACATLQLHSTSSTNEVWPSNAHSRSKRVGLAIPSHKPDHLLGPCNTWDNTGSVLPSHWLPNSKCIFQTEIENLGFQNKNQKELQIWAQNSKCSQNVHKKSCRRRPDWTSLDTLTCFRTFSHVFHTFAEWSPGEHPRPSSGLNGWVDVWSSSLLA